MNLVPDRHGFPEDGRSGLMREKCELTRRKCYVIRRFVVLTPGKMNIIVFWK